MKSRTSTPLWLIQFFLAFTGSLFLSWLLLAQVNFLYPLNYRLISIDKTIAEFAPLNRYRDHFATTPREEHFRLFGEIVDAITGNAASLSGIEYRTDRGEPIDSLLTPAEIVHLQDVANLVAIIDVAGYSTIFAGLLLVGFMRVRNIAFPSIAKIHIYGSVFLIVTVLLIVVIGAEKVFYAAHVWVFPPDHQWFFYYEESLMTTLMKAPDLFALIAVELLTLALLIYTAILVAQKRYFAR